MARTRRPPSVVLLPTACLVPLVAAQAAKSSQAMWLTMAALADADSDTHLTPQPLVERQMAVSVETQELLAMETVVLAVALVVPQLMAERVELAGLAAAVVAVVRQKLETAALAEQAVAGGCSSSQSKENQ